MTRSYKSEYQSHPIYERMVAPGPKRILALDGGGIRGALTLGYLEAIERLLRSRFEDETYTLSQYYDLIGGTSTGAIIATLLASGWSVKRIKELYLELGSKIFANKIAPWIPGKLRFLLLSANYSERALEEELEKQLGKMVLGSEKLKSGLCIVTRRADDYGTYTFSNHPGSPYYEFNKGILLSDIVRASSAAPTFFKSKIIQFGDDEKGIFVDGGVSSANNPALNLFMIATMEQYGYNWHMGKQELLITSIGTGSYRPKIQMKAMQSMLKRKSIAWAPELPNLFMADAASLNHNLLEYLADPTLSKHVGHHDVDSKTNFSKGAFTYHRYDVALSKNSLQQLSLQVSDAELRSLREMDHGQNAEKLYKIGASASEKQVMAKQFPAIFNWTKERLEEKAMSASTFHDKIVGYMKNHGIPYRKTRFVIAKEAEGGEQITTLVDRQIETKNIAKSGDFIVHNQTSDAESYIVQKAEFHQRYDLVRTLPDGQGEYAPKLTVFAVQLTRDALKEMGLPKHFLFTAPWGEQQYARLNDYIICKEDYTNIYRASLRMFSETYSPI